MIRLRQLTLHPHPMCDDLEGLHAVVNARPASESSLLREYIAAIEGSVQASCTFGNGWTVSIIACAGPHGSHLRLFHGDLTVPDYEIMAIGPATSIGPLAHQTEAEVDDFLTRIAGLPALAPVEAEP